MFSGSWIRPSLQQLYCLPRKAFVLTSLWYAERTLIMEELIQFCCAMACTGVVAPRSTALLSLTSSEIRIPRENSNTEATDSTKPVTKHLCSGCLFFYLRWRIQHLQPFKASHWTLGYRQARSWGPQRKFRKSLRLHWGDTNRARIRGKDLHPPYYRHKALRVFRSHSGLLEFAFQQETKNERMSCVGSIIWSANSLGQGTNLHISSCMVSVFSQEERETGTFYN